MGLDIICFNIDEEFYVYVPWGTQPKVEFFNCIGKFTSILSGEPTIFINGLPTTIKVWKVTILPFKALVSGTIKMCNREWEFSTFKKKK